MWAGAFNSYKEINMIAIDAHLDLSWNALNWNRDLTLDVSEIRRLERGEQESNLGTNTVSFPALRKGDVAVSLATVLARASNLQEARLDFRNQQIAYAMAQGQLAYYRVMEREGQLRMLRDWSSFEAHLRDWRQASGSGVPLGYTLSMEGADPIVSPSQVIDWWNDGLRVVGPVHYGMSAYAHGTGSPGGLTAKGRDLLKAMGEVGMILDVTHLADGSFWEAVELFQGPVLASHHNCRSLVPGDRQLTDEQIKLLIQRDSVIGAAFDAWMLYPGWVPGQTPNTVVSLEAVVDHIDHVCQLAGNARHSALGTDLDGGFGTEQSPYDLNTIADLQKLPILLSKRGYREADVEAIMHGNWSRFFRDAWRA
jgi:membrane dipeptidase